MSTISIQKIRNVPSAVRRVGLPRATAGTQRADVIPTTEGGAVSEQPESAHDAHEAARTYADPHSDAQTSLSHSAGPEDTDPVDSMATEVREPDEADEDHASERTSGDGQ